MTLGRVVVGDHPYPGQVAEYLCKLVIYVKTFLLCHLEQFLPYLHGEVEAVLVLLAGQDEGVQVGDAVPGGLVQQTVWRIAFPDSFDTGHSEHNIS